MTTFAPFKCFEYSSRHLPAPIGESAVDSALTETVGRQAPVGSLLSLVLTTIVSMGVIAFFLRAHDDPDRVALADLWHPRPFWKYLGASRLLVLGGALGFLLLIVLGIIFVLMFMFTTLIVIDRGLGPIEAMKESSRITRGHRWTLLGLALLVVLVNLLGLLALVVGLLVSVPVSWIALAHVYRVLARRTAPDAAMAASAA